MGMDGASSQVPWCLLGQRALLTLLPPQTPGVTCQGLWSCTYSIIAASDVLCMLSDYSYRKGKTWFFSTLAQVFNV